MNTYSFTKQEEADIIQGLNASVFRLSNKIKNDERNERIDFDRISWRKKKIERAKLLIEKISYFDNSM